MLTPNLEWLHCTHERLQEKGLVCLPFHLDRVESQGITFSVDALCNAAPLLSQDDARKKGQEVGVIVLRPTEKYRSFRVDRQQCERVHEDTRLKITLERILFPLIEKGERTMYRAISHIDIEGREAAKTVFRTACMVGKDLVYSAGMYWGLSPERRSVTPLRPADDVVFRRVSRLKDLKDKPSQYLDAVVDLAASCLPYWRTVPA